jgi:hypothetical protein
MNHHSRRVAALSMLAVTLMVVLSSCGPQVDSSYQMNEKPVSILYGPTPTPVPTAPPVTQSLPSGDFPGFGGPVVSGPTFNGEGTGPSLRPAATPSPPPCLQPPKGAQPALLAGPNSGGMPASASYLYTRLGTATRGGKTVDLGGTVRETFKNAKAIANPSANPPAAGGGGPNGYSFDVQELTPTGVTTISYAVVSGQTEQGQVIGTVSTGGLEIYSITTTNNDGSPGWTFQPASPVHVFDVPAATTSATTGPETSVGTDPLTGETMKITYQNTGRQHVDTCGAVLDTWNVSATGTLVDQTPGHKQNLTLTDIQLNVVPQYGCMVVYESASITGTDDTGASYTSSEESYIDSIPQLPVPVS